MANTDKCKCIEETNKALKEHNAELATCFQFNFTTGKSSLGLPVALRKIDKSRKPLPTLMPNYCPFCGRSMNLKTKASKAAK